MVIKMNQDFTVDMVYLWCDGKDPAFLKRKEEYDHSIQARDEDTRIVRFYDNEELRYSLRSLYKNAPWIRHIFIVTDRQIPSWLNTDNPQITVVDHSEILPKELIPCFNSAVIDKFLGFIPHLSEHFIYGDDDHFFGRPVTKDFFFQDGKPIVRVRLVNKQLPIMHNENEFESVYKKTDNMWLLSLMNSWDLLYKKYHIFNQYEPHHNMDGYTVSAWKKTFDTYSENLEANFERFRSKKDIQRVLFNLDMVYNHTGILKVIPKLHPWRKHLFWLKKLDVETVHGIETPKSLHDLEIIDPALYCVNNSEDNSIENKKAARAFFERKFPSPSPYEK